MKFPLRKQIFFSFLFLVVSFAGYAKNIPPRPDKLVNDYVNVLSSSDRKNLEDKLDRFDKYTGIQIAIVLDSSLEGENIDKYSNRLFNTWGIGQKGKDNGILIYAATRDRKVRIEIGSGLEKFLTNAQCRKIINQVITPYFKDGRYAMGLETASGYLFYEAANIDSVALGNLRVKGEKVSSQFEILLHVYQRHSDLIGKLLVAVKSTTNFKKSNIIELEEARKSASLVYVDISDLNPEIITHFQKAQDTLQNALTRFMLATEKYSKLKSNQSFSDLTSELEGCENRISLERRNYNEAVKDYNTTYKEFAQKSILKALGFTPKGFFAATASDIAPPTVKFNDK